ncbi:MAG: Glutamate 5-kinase [Verrucomicrobiae bacterium]|nr:Glutamate 5-kinase [Verrucomicrobiae bacterium]
MKLRREILARTRRVVVKFGTGLLTDDQNRLAVPAIERLARQVATLHSGGRQVVLVSSGAIAAGMGALGFARRPKHLPELQAAAAIGQGKLMALYGEVFGQLNLHVAQILLTHDDLKSRGRHLSARSTLETLLARGIIPIINENDTVAVDEIKFGDNDRLGALTATLIDADLLIILSHVEGLLDRTRQLIPVVPEITREIEALAGGTDRVTSVGGMKSKIDAAKICTRAGIPMIIADGDRGAVIGDVVDGGDIGTIFLPKTGKLESRKRWIAFFQKPVGNLVVDDGARQALCTSGKSLLAQGVVRTEGKFTAGDLVTISDLAGNEFARGLVKGSTGVVVHRDDLVIL